jgi:hypothetical protein
MGYSFALYVDGGVLRAATNSWLICPEMAVRVLSNIALYQKLRSEDVSCISCQQSAQSHIVFVGRTVPTPPVIPLTSG